MGKVYDALDPVQKKLVDDHVAEFVAKLKAAKTLLLDISKPKSVDIYREHMSSPAGIRFIELNNAARNPLATDAFKRYADDPAALVYIRNGMAMHTSQDAFDQAGNVVEPNHKVLPENKGLYVRKMEAARAALNRAESITPAELDQIRAINDVQNQAIVAASGANPLPVFSLTAALFASSGAFLKKPRTDSPPTRTESPPSWATASLFSPDFLKSLKEMAERKKKGEKGGEGSGPSI